MVALISAVRDSALQATVLNTTPLFYSQGADLSIDRSAHVRAGSSLTWFGDFLAIVQDDANFLVLINPSDLQVNAITLNVEGVCLSKKSKNRLYLVIDADNPILPCELCEVEITGE
ncbi:hypothetical protein C7H19_04700 [Aphanothece hegewaldii CCALA 016]|uniref:Uncharacterized protein n=1 Tax=Aphanothece hegewaldii CCALA 016 TaxID=2107694 RepID=A0A2T1M0U9_9CHRO|nr:hypothetical protein [Aphanothece hegewaldii]PSF38297.1 hypothetical protein C7H19_04700 [Aphanothece hegewaldii CCALA 016]